MAMLRLTRPALYLGAVLALAGCEDGDLPAFLNAPAGDETASAAVSAGPTTTTVERDIEAPEIFQVDEAGLWDGRPSLGGVWVAHPDVKEPERVLIRNDASGKFVIGALFRRERDNPGPRLQVSSDAAETLGMLAGQPMKLSVTALRREEAKPAPAPEPAPEPEPQPEPAVEEPVIQKAEAAPAPEPAEAPDTAVASVDDIAAPAPEAGPAKKGFFATLFAPKPKDEEELAPLSAISPSLDAPPAVETSSLDDPAPAPAKPFGSLGKPFIQIGIFSVEKNAQDAATALRRDGILPTVREQASSGKTFWRVLVGPATSSSERSAILKKVKALGYNDAYFVTN